MQIHELPTGTLGDSDYAAIDNGSTNRKLSLKSAINSLITSGISAIQSALTTAQNNITALQNSMSTANTNIGALQTKVGSASTSNVGDGSLAGAVGNTVMGTTATTLSGAVKEHEDQIGNTDITGVGDGTITGAISTLSVVGTIYSDSASNTSVATGTYADKGTITLPAGTYVITGVGNFGSNATGRRLINLSTTSGTLTDGIENIASAQAVNGYGTILSRTFIRTLTAETTYYLVVRQDSGSSINIGGSIRAVRIA